LRSREEMEMKKANVVALVLVIIGGLNWGAIGVMKLNVVTKLVGEETIAARAIYIVVGLAAIYSLSFFPKVLRGRKTEG